MFIKMLIEIFDILQDVQFKELWAESWPHLHEACLWPTKNY